ncbi:MAG TPA: hypothetical protein VLT79_05625 [Gemmatimonadales bacterium]|nr:hypothetical protein [Gemmatimonadales bacterium]
MRRTSFGWIPLLLLACNTNDTVQSTTPPAPCTSNGVSFALLCAIKVTGNPLVSVAKVWTDTTNGSVYVDDQSNSGVDVLSATNYTYVGRVPGFVGAAVGASGGTISYGGGTPTTNGQGPNSLVPIGNGKIWVSDGNTMVRVVTIASLSIDTSISLAVAGCDGGTATTHFCGRNNEMTYDPDDKIVVVETPNPLDLAYCQANAATCATQAAVSYPTTTPLTQASYATFISATPPYPILGRISFTDVKGTPEAPVWDPQVGGTGRFLFPVPTCSGTTGATACAGSPANATQYIAVVDPKNLGTYGGVYTSATAGTYLIPSCDQLGSAGQSGMINDESFDLADHTLIMPACGHEVVVNTLTGAVLNNTAIQQVGASDETSFNPGDGNFYVVGAIPAGQPSAGFTALGQVSGKTGLWIQNVVNTGGRTPSAYSKTNRVFTVSGVSTGQVANTATDTTSCVAFGYKGTGCVTVFGK